MNLFTECAVGFASSVVLMSLIEHQCHQTAMHKKHPLSKYIKVLEKVFKHHAVLHHSEYKAVFADVPLPKGEDRGIRLNFVEGFFEALPFSLLLALVSVPTAIIFEGVVACHHLIWNNIHLNMHRPVKRFFNEWPAYKYLTRHHYLHHVHPDKNFNVVFPLGDFVFGTVCKPTAAEIADMQRQGMYSGSPAQTEQSQGEVRVLEGARK
ncbi:MAG: sterol desaturase family protein [Candidatus Obscuribacterales bacterium]|nr:sterol desaturase family protein [Candidatus Obscuribacterales bacterium]